MPMTVADVLGLQEAMDLAPEAFVEADVRFMRHTWNFAEPVLAPLNASDRERPLALWMVRRSIFDNALAERAAAAGAELCDSLPVREITLEAGAPVRITAGADGAEWQGEAPVVIGADGANGICARSAGLRTERALAIAIEAEVPHHWGDGHQELRADICHLEFGAVQRGYAWVFPKGDHLNVGAGVFRPNRREGRGDSSVRAELRSAIVRYLEMLGVPHAEAGLKFHAHPLPIWDGLDRIQTRDNRVLLVGDSAGLIQPFFGDGILHALKSGQIAAQSILDGHPEAYTRQISGEFKKNFDAALRLARVFYRWPRLCYRHGVVLPGSTQAAARLLAGELLFNNVSGRVMRRLRAAGRSEGHPALEGSEV